MGDGVAQYRCHALETTGAFNASKGAMATVVALSISNLLNITYWAALGGTIAATSETPSLQDFTIFISGFMLSSVLWCFFAAKMIAFTRSNLTPILWRYLHLGCCMRLVLMMMLVLGNVMEIILGHSFS